MKHDQDYDSKSPPHEHYGVPVPADSCPEVESLVNGAKLLDKLCLS